MKPNDSPARLVRAVVACVVLGVLAVSCGDDDEAGVVLRNDAGHPVRDGRARRHGNDSAGRRILSDWELDCGVR